MSAMAVFPFESLKRRMSGESLILTSFCPNIPDINTLNAFPTTKIAFYPILRSQRVPSAMKEPTRHGKTAKQSIALQLLFCFLLGFLYSLGVFSPAVEAYDETGSLDGVWSSGMAGFSAFSIPSMFIAGIYLSGVSGQDSKTNRVRFVTALAAICFGLLALGGFGVTRRDSFIVRCAFFGPGAGFGMMFLACMEMLAVWYPRRPGLIVGIGQMTYGIGSIAASSLFKYLLVKFSTPTAIYITSATISIPLALSVPFIQWAPSDLDSPDQGSEAQPLVQHRNTPLSIFEIAYIPAFWLYIYSIFSLRAGMAFVAYFFKIGKTFGKDMGTLVTSFQAATIAGTLARPVTGALADVLKYGVGFFSLGSKNAIIVLLMTQAASFLALIRASSEHSYRHFAFFAGLTQVIFAAGTCCVPLLAREQFGSINSCVVFGTGGSLATGFGEIFAVSMMALVESCGGQSETPTEYSPYYALGFFWSVCGLLSAILLRPHKVERESVFEPKYAQQTSYVAISSSS